MCTQEDIEAVLRYINTLRYGKMDASSHQRLAAAEHLTTLLFQTDTRLAVYGSLMPGEKNHPFLSDMKGRWMRGLVEGTLGNADWKTGTGYPTFEWKPGKSQVHVHVLESTELSDHWARLDDFEGDDYQRMLVPDCIDPVLIDKAPPIIANIYESKTY